MLNWGTSKEDLLVIGKIADRAMDYTGGKHRIDIVMDLEATHNNGCPLDLEKMLAFDSFNFMHDIHGINQNINRETGKLENCFLPRCAR
jgi:hypothetical protein